MSGVSGQDRLKAQTWALGFSSRNESSLPFENVGPMRYC